jgi:hypothetical protein
LIILSSEIPELRTSEYEAEGSFGPVADDASIAYPGQGCASGQECLLDSQCNGTSMPLFRFKKSI